MSITVNEMKPDHPCYKYAKAAGESRAEAWGKTAKLAKDKYRLELRIKELEMVLEELVDTILDMDIPLEVTAKARNLL